MALMMCNQTDGKDRAESTEVTELSPDLQFPRAFFGGAFVATVPELCLGPVVKIMVFILIRIKGKN